MNQELWTAVDEYFTKAFLPSDAALDNVLQASEAAGLPPHHVAPNQGKLLQLLSQIQGAKRILEIGTLGGYSTIWFARAVLPDGCVITLEVNPQYADIATYNIARAGLAEIVDIKVGTAIDSIRQLVQLGVAPFDVIFTDADKPSNPEYLCESLKLSHPGTIIIGDNVVREGEVANAACSDPKVQGVRQFCDLISLEPRLSATAIQTVGSKGYDGLVLARVMY
ncbi:MULTISPECIES: O-methyltransferase [Cyanophyceae]|uniref:O-methyltransferase n=1 Tax=Cyanophyceae TaxID=3028117 RepID=UPI00168648E9|nr:MULTISPECIES: O-methyltransferase [Cyanophyceae]MBD1915467.1 O-methyltransferase [Phormidium sp. FACHB-77]MBD2028538.1 O-methyltransferase [Phormidium sp. FACHB-322]MBD2051078.1 O-methyltransferase [Leptolyngbya sp. FACHB-60]